MFIHEAVKKAMEINGVIYRESARSPYGEYGEDWFAMIQPSDSYDCCRVLDFRDGRLERVIRCWNPTADDLLADDWCCGELLKKEGGTDEKRI